MVICKSIFMRRMPVMIALLSLTACTTAPVQTTGSGSTTLLIVGLVIGAVVMYLIGRLYAKNSVPAVKESSHTVVESIRRVFKVVFAEGQFNELYTYEETKKIFGFLPTTKKALVIIQAKVMVGYDFAKCAWEANEETKTIRLVQFPQPEIISIEPDYKYYDFDENIFNMMGGGDLNRIQQNGKKQVEQAALNSHLPAIAADQMRLLLTEVVQGKQWKLEGLEKITSLFPIPTRNPSDKKSA
jgi:hypothetical protein